jgi:hypothetical protein
MPQMQKENGSLDSIKRKESLFLHWYTLRLQGGNEIMPKFDPMNEPEQCPQCICHPDWLEICEGEYQCQNCFGVINSKGEIVEEGEEPYE